MAEVIDASDESTGKPRNGIDMLEDLVERVLFGSRWLLAPLYIGLVGGLLAILVKFVQAFASLWRHLFSEDYNRVELTVLQLLDITLLANLVLIVVFAGYETFVSKIGAAVGAEDRPHWMGHVDYSGLKMKLIGSIVAISVIGLLQDFLNAGSEDHVATRWRIFIHLTFLVSGVLFALMDLIAEHRLRIRVDDRST